MGVRFGRSNRLDTIQNNMALTHSVNLSHSLNLIDHFWSKEYRPTDILIKWLSENIGPSDEKEIIDDKNSFHIAGDGWRYESEMIIVNNLLVEPPYDPSLFHRSDIGSCVVYHRCQLFFEHESDAVFTQMMLADIKS